ncbi:oxygen-dependent protoporphyrinogen oxidase [Dimargaris verticillata]|uniref:Oxygen-dependent protoporphyrinogen oxidase n=1 Tax=Dimargaris verticillata TaxID=2761393 RepID=A0A9W8EBD9_9FUNG|nr:oxygen-dependent protoporphyrinogen oxidase [Dimargaris verticillata]
MRIAVLGGGLSGLATAHYLARRLLPAGLRSATSPVSITVLEAQDRWGGWVDTQFTPVEATADLANPFPAQNTVLCETGPRTLRPSGIEAIALRQLVDTLDLYDWVTMCSRQSASAQNRFVYYHDQLNRMPVGVLSLLRSVRTVPALRGLVSAVLREPWQPTYQQTLENVPDAFDGTNHESLRGIPADDESIYSFVSRRLGPAVADNLVSAVIHGIYAGDIRTLSVDATMRWLKDLERHHGSITRGVMTQAVRAAFSRLKQPLGSQQSSSPDATSDPHSTERLDTQHAARFWHNRTQALHRRYAAEHQATAQGPHQPFWHQLNQASVYTFQHGMATLIEALVANLSAYADDQVQLMLQSPVQRIRPLGKDGVAIDLVHRSEPLLADHVVSALPAHHLASLLKSSPIPLLAANPAVDVAVVNLAYQGRRRPVDGFGYLVPCSTPSDALGVVFDSCSAPEQDCLFPSLPPLSHATPHLLQRLHTSPVPIDRMTVMMGGYQFARRFGAPADTFQTTQGHRTMLQRALQMVDAQLPLAPLSTSPVERHQRPALVASRVSVHRQCLPQYLVGHRARLQQIQQALRSQYGHALSVTGASYLGPSMNACVHHARQLVDDLVEYGALSAKSAVVVTGIDRALI